MLTERENLKRVIAGEGFERYANHWKAFKEVFTPAFIRHIPQKGTLNHVNEWGVTISWRDDQPGAFPVHTPDKIVIQDFEDWKDYVKAPSVKYAEAEWEPFIEVAESINRKERYVMPVMAPGLFEQCHYLGEITETLMAFYEYPDEVKDLVKYIAEYELMLAEQIVDHLHPDALLHHDDWGTNTSTFFSPDMFADIFVEPYKEIYKYYHDHGVEVIVHHSDSYAATFVPYMIEMGIDVWQGALPSNDIPDVLYKYGNDITVMGDIDSAIIDVENWTPELIKKEVHRVMDECGPAHFIPCTTQGAPEVSNYEGVYVASCDAVSEYNDEAMKKWGY